VCGLKDWQEKEIYVSLILFGGLLAVAVGLLGISLWRTLGVVVCAVLFGIFFCT